MSQHEHDHSHDHAGEDTYYLDQLCMVALSAAFGSICLFMYFWNVPMLKRLLGEQFHPFVLGSGIALLILSIIRGAILWIQVGKDSAHAHGHDHAHETHAHEHSHDHAHVPSDDHVHAHDHGHDHHHEHAGHTHDHDHSHTHDHHDHASPSHSHADHDHAWAPWRYVVLMIPVILFMLGLPNRGPKVQAEIIDLSKDNSRQAGIAATWLALGPPSWSQLAVVQAASRARGSGEAKQTDFKTLEGAALTPELRKHWSGKRVKLLGQFAGDRRNDKVFFVVRFKMNCCASDAIQASLPIIAAESITSFKANDWILVTGEVEFIQDKNGYRTVLRIHDHKDVKETDPDPNPYI